MNDKFAALKDGDWLQFSNNKDPKCPHCASDFSIRENEAWELYDENMHHRIECDSCGNEFNVVANATWTFSTDEQEEDR